MNYRPEIDGLRALAVLPVILFHGGIAGFSGGYVGVDVFFVISGYLITTIILSDAKSGNFSFFKFYDRRIRRIFPTLFFVVLATMPFAWAWLTPADMRSYTNSISAVTLFSSNLLFWQETGYWGAANELKPLLHTWSLAVEEQYYLFFPPLLIALVRLKHWIGWVFTFLVSLTLLSFAASHWASLNAPQANFFLLPFRAWELGIGAILATYFVWRDEKNVSSVLPGMLGNILAFVGLIAIGYSVYVFDENTRFPGIAALLPTLGAASIVLFANSKNYAGRLLGMKPLVHIGLISYSAYLIHQPVFAFMRHYSLSTPDQTVFLLFGFVSLILAHLSWRYVEKPFRNSRVIGRRGVFVFFFAGSAVLVSFGLAGNLSNGYEMRSNSAGLTMGQLSASLNANHGLDKSCDGPLALPEACRSGSEPSILVWGDSHAMHLVQALQAAVPGAEIAQMTKSACGPILGIAPVATPKFSLKWTAGCLEFNNKALEFLKSQPSIRYVVLSSPLHRYLWGNRSVMKNDGTTLKISEKLAYDAFAKTLMAIEEAGAIPIIVSSPPSHGVDIGRCLTRSSWLGKQLDVCDFPRDDIPAWLLNTYRFIDRFSDSHQVVRLDKLLCNSGSCKTHIQGQAIYRDAGHLSVQGSAAFGVEYGFPGIVPPG
ncbi:MAG: acyltransferase family protein [Halioglobus sp.]